MPSARPNSNLVSAMMMPRGLGPGESPAVDRQAQVPDPRRQRRPDPAPHGGKGDIFVMGPQLGLGGGRKDRLRQLLGLHQPRWQGQTANGARLPVFGPTGTRR